MNLFIKEPMFAPIEAPLILLAPDYEGSKTFFSFYSEKALFDSNNCFFSCYLSAPFITPPNFFITSPNRSVAAYGGAYFSTFFFSYFPPFFFFSSYFYTLTSLTLGLELFSLIFSCFEEF